METIKTTKTTKVIEAIKERPHRAQLPESGVSLHDGGRWTTRLFGATRIVSLVLAALLALAPVAAVAGPEGVFVSDSVYFTLDKVRLTAGETDTELRFAVKLHNGSDAPVDYNAYGVRVTDMEGYSYAAQLTGTQRARVMAGEEKSYAYEARLPLGLQGEQLLVTMFRWDGGAQMTDIGSFSVAHALREQAADDSAELTLAELDSSMSADARVSYRLEDVHPVYEDGSWALYMALAATNLGSASVTVPSGLGMRLAHESGQTAVVETVQGTGQTLPPGEAQRIALRAGLPALGTGDDPIAGWTLEWYKNVQDRPYVLDSLTLAGKQTATAVIGEPRPLVNDQGQATADVVVDSALLSFAEDGQWVRAVVIAGPGSGGVMATPKLSAAFQTASGDIAVAAVDSGTHGAYVAAGTRETYTFTAQLPNGIDISELRLILFETRGTGSAGGTATGASGSGSDSAGTGNGGSTSTGGGGSASTGGGSSTGNGSSAGTGSSASASSGTKFPVMTVDLGAASVSDASVGETYALGQRIMLEHGVKAGIAMQELELYDHENYGFRTAVAKLKVTNLDQSAFTLPDLRIDLVDRTGTVYSGTRQANVISQLPSGGSYLLTYSFLLSEAEPGDPVMLRLYAGDDAIPLYAARTAFGQGGISEEQWDVYPYRMTVKQADLLVGQLSTTFSYTLNLDVALERTEQVLADASVSKLQFELEDAMGLVLSTAVLPFTGATRLVDGSNTVMFSNLKLNQFSSTNYVNVYEVIETPHGAVKRKLGEIR